MTPNPTARPFVRQRATGPFWYGKWSRNGQPVIRALGRAWVEPDGEGRWRRKRGRPPQDVLTEAQAAERMLTFVREHDAEQTLLERDAEERRRRGVTFRELSGEYLEWLEHVQGAKPSTLRDHRFLLAEPGQPHRRGHGASRGLLMAALGGRPAREVTTREVEDLLGSISSTGVAPRTVNKVRQLVCAIFNYGMRQSTYGLPSNPAAHADRRREPETGPLAFYSPEQIEVLARTLAAGAHRDPLRPALNPSEIEARAREDLQTPTWFVSRPTPDSAEASSSLCAGVMSTSTVARSSSGAHCPPIRSFARPRAAAHGRCHFRIKQQLHLIDSGNALSSPVPTTTSS
jgi:hypothetical protein